MRTEKLLGFFLLHFVKEIGMFVFVRKDILETL